MIQDGVQGIAQYQLKKLFTSRFYNPDYYRSHRPSPMLLEVEENLQGWDNLYLRDALDFCLKTDVCKTLNMSLMDLMNLDVATYELIKETVRKENERKAKIIEKQQQDLNRRQQQLLGGKKYVQSSQYPQRRG